MENHELTRFELLIGNDNLNNLKNKKVAVFGIGGVGGYVVEMLVRSGIGTIGLIDNDIVSITNLNRQIIATYDTIGMPKVEVMEQRIKSINKNITVKKYQMFYLPELANEFDFEEYDYIVDAIDTVTGKLSLIEESKKRNIPIISSMGTGNKLNPLLLEITDISKTSICPLARTMRYELKKRNINHVDVIYSKELPIKTNCFDKTTKKNIPASSAFVPSAAGIAIASYVIRKLINQKEE